MNDPVAMIAFQMQPILQPEPGRHFRVGVVRTDRMKHEKNENEGVGKIRELKLAISESQHADADEDQKIFKKPVAAIERMNGERDPKHDITPQRHGQEV